MRATSPPPPKHHEWDIQPKNARNERRITTANCRNRAVTMWQFRYFVGAETKTRTAPSAAIVCG